MGKTLWALALLMASVGCGKSAPVTGKVAGKLTYKGQPVSDALVIFESAETQRTITAPVKADGTYEVVIAGGEGLPVGNYQVWVTPPPHSIPMEQFKTPPPPKQYPNIPQKFREPETSGLTLQVVNGQNNYDIAM